MATKKRQVAIASRRFGLPACPISVGELQWRGADGARDDRAWSALHRHYDSHLRQALHGQVVAGRQLRNADIDEIIQSIWIKVELSINGYRGNQAQFPAWLREVAWSAYADEVRRRARSARNDAESTAKLQAWLASEAALAQAVDEERDILEELIARLPLADRRYLRRYRELNADHQALAAALGYASARISHQRYSRIIRRLKRVVQDRGGQGPWQ